MFQYFQTKLVKIASTIESVKTTLLKQVADESFRGLKELSQQLMQLEQDRKEFTIDAINNLTVDEVIAIHHNKDYYGEVRTTPLKRYDVEYGYTYKSKAISIGEREKLKKVFGHYLDKAKV